MTLSVNPAPAATGSTPPELAPARRGRPPGSTNKPRAMAAVAEISARSLAAAYQGLWLVLRMCTWLVAGRDKSPVAQATHTAWKLDDLDSDEALADAKDLMPFVTEIPALIRVLAWVGGPVIVVKRVAGKLRKKAPKLEAAPEPKADPLDFA